MKLWPIAEHNENFNIIGIISGLAVQYRIPDIKSNVRMEMIMATIIMYKLVNSMKSYGLGLLPDTLISFKDVFVLHR